MRRISSDDVFTKICYTKVGKVTLTENYVFDKYIACIYDQVCYIAMILERSNENQDVRYNL